MLKRKFFAEDSSAKPNKHQKIFNVYFSKDHGAIITSDPRSMTGHEKRFKQLQVNISLAMEPLIDMIKQSAQEALTEFQKNGEKILEIPPDNIASKLLTLRSILSCSNKFFGQYQPHLPVNAVESSKYLPSIDELACTLSELTGADEIESYKFLLKINACKGAICYWDACSSDFPQDDRMYFDAGRNQPDYYKKGLEEVESFEQFEIEIKKSLGYICLEAGLMRKNSHQPAESSGMTTYSNRLEYWGH